MKSKLTLSIDTELVTYAKQEAEHTGQSVSSMFSDFLSAQKTQAKKQTTPSVGMMVGSLKRYNIDDSKVAISTAYAKKYSR